MCESNEGYGRWGDAAHCVRMDELDYDGKKDYVKMLWQEDPVKYFEWKAHCIRANALPDFFGTRDNPIPIDESKL